AWRESSGRPAMRHGRRAARATTDCRAHRPRGGCPRRARRHTRRMPTAAPSEADLDVRFAGDVNAVDEPDLMRIVLHDDGARPRAVAEKSDAAHERPVGHAGGRKDDTLAGSEIVRSIEAFDIGMPTGMAA